MKEIWKDIANTNGYYQISNCGHIRSTDREVVCCNGVVKHLKGKMLTPQVNRNGYLFCKISGIAKELHRHVAEAFIPNPNNYPCVNHKDNNPLNNNVDNLEWCTYKYNNNYGTHREKQILSRGTPVTQMTLDGEYIKTYPSAREAARVLGISQSGISKNARGESYFANDYCWIYPDELIYF